MVFFAELTLRCSSAQRQIEGMTSQKISIFRIRDGLLRGESLRLVGGEKGSEWKGERGGGENTSCHIMRGLLVAYDMLSISVLL